MDQEFPTPTCILKRGSSDKPTTYCQEYQQQMKAMQTELAQLEVIPYKPVRIRRADQERRVQTINIASIGAYVFQRNLKDKKHEFFTTSLYEIDQIIKSRQPTEEDAPELETEEEMLRCTVPEEYHDLIDIFSKLASDKLPPHWQYDHKIHLEEDVPLGYHPLYHQTEEELRALKKYLIENLEKGFIAHSSAPFASPVLFVKNPSRGLRFCIDYHKLNAITKKDQYPLPLLDDTLARLSCAKIFTKLDIRRHSIEYV